MPLRVAEIFSRRDPWRRSRTENARCVILHGSSDGPDDNRVLPRSSAGSGPAHHGLQYNLLRVLIPGSNDRDRLDDLPQPHVFIVTIRATYAQHDAIRIAADGSRFRVEFKATQVETKRAIIAFSATVLDDPPDELIVLVIQPDGSVDEAYHGPAAPILARLRGSGDQQRTISLARIRRISDASTVEALIETEDA